MNFAHLFSIIASFFFCSQDDVVRYEPSTPVALAVNARSHNAGVIPALAPWENAQPHCEPPVELQNYIVVDRLSDTHATLEFDGEVITVPRHILPKTARIEGAVLRWQHVPEAQTERLQTARRRIERLENMSADGMPWMEI